ncbi:hypothetical protein MMC29_002413 [Sticta canariensis]|nr:hypothetical protein [Sticta canariensis]
MRLSTALLVALPALAATQQQFPLANTLQSWFEKAKSYLPDAATAPVTTAAAKAAAANITPLTVDNWQSVLSPSPSHASNTWDGPETWMVFVSGTNKTCYGLCGGLEVSWNETAALFAADPTAPHLGYINCDRSPVLCAIWHAHPPTVWYIQLPIPAEDQSRAPTTVHILRLNTTTTTTQDIVRIHTEKTYEKVGVYEGAFQPFDGWLAQLGFAKPIGYVLFGVSMVPSWAFMIVISLVSRNLMNRRIGNPDLQRLRQAQRQAPQGGAPPANE